MIMIAYVNQGEVQTMGWMFVRPCKDIFKVSRKQTCDKQVHPIHVHLKKVNYSEVETMNYMWHQEKLNQLCQRNFFFLTK